ncbi:hypothetical protein JL722_8675 [Aureococcus anophagefferens]|nr:hypothetical protein JL722_8675 [Aureococcus anophagefferens]
MALVAATTSMAPAPEVDDFATLCEVETAVVAKMQGDERGGFDLCEQLSHGWAWAQSFGSTAAAARGAHEYFSEPFGSQGLGLAVRGFARWPAFVTAEARRLGAAGAPQSAGLLPEIGCAWAALGAALVVWDYRRGDDFAVYEGLRDAVSAVCLAPPKPRVFVDAVKDVLVVATPSDVSLLALVFEPDANQPPGARGRLRVLPTEFGATTADLDGATFAGAAASRDGRVFFAASDGFVHEFEYAARESVLGRVARMVLPGGNPPAPPPPPPNPDAPKKRPPPAGYEGFSAAKCARRDPSAVRRLATALLPPFARPEWLLHPMRFLGVDGAGKDGLVDVVVDDARGALYALSARGVLGVYDLGKRGRDLRHSATVHCVCVDDAGFRFYFSTTAPKSGLGARVDAAANAALPPPTADGADDALRPRALTLVHVRAPPPAALWDGARRARAAGRRREDQVSAPPSTDARELYGAKVGASFYGNGVFVVAKASGRDADRVLECAVDARDAAAPRRSLRSPPVARRLLLRAGLRADAVARAGAVARERRRRRAQVWALGEACDRGGIAAKLRALAALSRTPAQRDARPYDRLVAPLAAREGDAFVAAERKRRRAAAVAAGKGKDLDDDALVALGGGAYDGAPCPLRPLHGGRHFALALPDRRGDDGGSRAREYAAAFARLPELASQHVVGERRLVCLTRLGVEELAKVRPVDALRELLRSDLGDGARRFGSPADDKRSGGGDAALRAFAESYGRAEACAMALAIACGADAGGGASDRHEALLLLASRLLRPVWFKPLLWFEDGRDRATFLLDAAELQALSTPVQELRNALRDEPALAVATRRDVLAAERARLSAAGLAGGPPARSSRRTRPRATPRPRGARPASSTSSTASCRGRRRRSRSSASSAAREAEDRCWAEARDAAGRARRSLLGLLGGPAKAAPKRPATAVDARLKQAARLTEGLRHAEAEDARAAAAAAYLRAAGAWRSPSDVLPAAAPGASPPALATACDALRVHGCAAAAVEVALACAKNFAPASVPATPATLELAGDHWELALYRGRPPDGAQRRDEDAREACHDVALDALKRELWRCGAARRRPPRARGDGADGALLACCGAKRGPFLDRCLEAAKAADDRRLVKLPLDAVEVYLRAADPGLLWRHHLAHGEDARAAALMEDLATAPGGDLDARVSCLVRAAESAARAAGGAAGASRRRATTRRRSASSTSCWPWRGSSSGASGARRTCSSTRGATADAEAARGARDGEPGGEAAQLHDAGLENERALDLERVAATLEERLVGVSELYNDVASRYGMWDLCLVTLKVCGHDDEPLAVKLWTSLLRRLVPRRARDASAQARLGDAGFWAAPGNGDGDEPYWDDGRAASGAFFEDRTWLRPLCDAVASLGASSPTTTASWATRARTTRAVDARSALVGAARDASDLEKLHALANAADVLDAWATAAANDVRERRAFASGLRHGADPEHLIATLRGFEHTADPLLDKTLNLLHNTRDRVDAIFSR